jgi:hypothetical protein
MTAFETTGPYYRTPYQTTFLVRPATFLQRPYQPTDLPESPKELQRRLIVPLLQSGEVDELLFRATSEVMGVELLL